MSSLSPSIVKMPILVLPVLAPNVPELGDYSMRGNAAKLSCDRMTILQVLKDANKEQRQKVDN